MKDFQKRAFEEEFALLEKIVNLMNFMCTTTFAALPKAERERLIRQLEAMNKYKAILLERIREFT